MATAPNAHGVSTRAACSPAPGRTHRRCGGDRPGARVPPPPRSRQQNNDNRTQSVRGQGVLMTQNTTRPPWAAQSRAPDGGGPLADSPAVSASRTAGSDFAELSGRSHEPVSCSGGRATTPFVSASPPYCSQRRGPVSCCSATPGSSWRRLRRSACFTRRSPWSHMIWRTVRSSGFAGRARPRGGGRATCASA
jgi:hypothetical protein